MAFTKPRAKRSKVSRRKAPKRSVSTAVKQYVKRTIGRGEENKMVNRQNTTSYTTGIALAWNDISISVPQGLGAGQRIGNQVKIKSVFFNMVLTLANASLPPYAPNYYGQFDCRLLMGSTRGNPFSSPTAIDNGQLLRFGSSTTGADSSLQSQMRPINKVYWNIGFDKKFKVGAGVGIAIPFTTSNDYRLSYLRRFNITKLFKKTQMFNDATGSNLAQNSSLYFNMIVCDYLGTPLNYTSSTVQIAYEIDYTYEDA